MITARAVQLKRLIATCFLVVIPLLPGCDVMDPSQQDKTTAAVDRALCVAVAELKSKDLLNDDEFTIHCVRSDEDKEWHFYFRFLPETPDDAVSVFVPDAGGVVVSK